MQLDSFIYISHPYAFGIGVIHSGVYVNGVYFHMSADQFISKETLNLYTNLLFENTETKPRYPRTCTSCEKICRNLTVSGDCCDYEPMLGLYN
jgi:hypothetical protein